MFHHSCLVIPLPLLQAVEQLHITKLLLWPVLLHRCSAVCSLPVNGKGKVNHTPQESIGGCSSPSPRPRVHRWRTTNVCDAWPVRRQTYGYLPSHKASLPIGWYQIIQLGDRGTCVLTTCRGLHDSLVATQCH